MNDRDAPERTVKVEVSQSSRWFWWITASVGIFRIEGGHFALGEKRAIKKARRWKAKLEQAEARAAGRREVV